MKPVRVGIAVGSLFAFLGAVVIGFAVLRPERTPEGWIPAHYAKTASADVYRADQPPTKVAGTVARRFKPVDRVYDSSGVFLRYSRTMVAVLPDGRGSKVHVLPLKRGYRTYHSHVGGYWGGPGGRASSFRGGGPGSGK